jgi:Mg2+ and Co2+ transporter CorA
MVMNAQSNDGFRALRPPGLAPWNRAREETLALLREVFKIHPLAIEDATEFHQRPKIEDYDDFVSIVAYGARGLASLLRYRTGAARAAADRWSHPADAPENG